MNSHVYEKYQLKKQELKYTLQQILQCFAFRVQQSN